MMMNAISRGGRMAALGAGLLALMAGTALAQDGQTVVDAAGRTVEVGAAQRIVSIGGDVTEIVYALGGGDRVIARDGNSLYPIEARELPSVGARTQLASEGVLSTDPDLVLVSENSGPPETMEALMESGIPVILVPNVYTAEGLVAKVELIAEVLEAEEDGATLAAEITGNLEAIASAVAGIPDEERKRVLFTHALSGGEVSAAAGANTPADAIIRLAGGVNALSDMTGVRPASSEAVAAAQPEVILMHRYSDGRAPSIAEIFEAPALQATPAAASQSAFVMDGAYMLGFGPRTADAILALAATLYPDLDLPELTRPAEATDN